VTRFVDLDDAAGLHAAWAQLERGHHHRSVDPELLELLEGLILKMPEATATEIREALDTVHPAVVLREFWVEFCAARFGAA
jgi:hypothetical protein